MTFQDYHIQAYQSTDKARLLELLALNTPHYFAPEEATDFSHYLDNKVDDYFVVVKDNTIIACGGVNYFREQKKVHISWDMVHPDFQGKGIGKQLLQHRLNLIRKEKGIEKVIVNTSQFAETFYAGQGFKTLSEEKDYWAKGIHLLHMELKLS